MPFGNSVVVTYNAVAKTLTRINQDGYGSEYLLREATQEFRMKIRHSKEGLQANGNQFDRHNVELTQTIYPTESAPAVVRQAYVVLRNNFADTDAGVGHLDSALIDFLDGSGVVTDLINWAN
nr:MAG: putative coat protein [Leviviridae sp.]